jgi:hypothetical protein
MITYAWPFRRPSLAADRTASVFVRKVRSPPPPFTLHALSRLSCVTANFNRWAMLASLADELPGADHIPSLGRVTARKSGRDISRASSAGRGERPCLGEPGGEQIGINLIE